MRIPYRIIAGPLLLALAAWSCGAAAQDAAAAAAASASAPAPAPATAPADGALPAPVRQNGATYLCGGVSSDSADSMRQAARQYDLMVTFATRDGSFLADVDVDIVDGRGQSVLQAHCGGPMMLVSLAKPGRYTVRGTVAGQVASGAAQVGGAKGKPVSLTWPARQQ